MAEPSGENAMGKRVLVAVDFLTASEPAILYGIELAARIESSLVLIAVAPANPQKKTVQAEASGQTSDGPSPAWMDRALAESRRRAVAVEIFVTAGRFFEEIIRFAGSQPGVQFIVMAAPKDRAGKDGSKVASGLKRLHQEFEGEILLVEKAGEITRVSDLYLHNSV
jgi:nucleotide-binding universal stress UspA family protein